MKQASVETLRFSRDYVDRGRPFQTQGFVQSELAAQIHAMEVGYREHQRRKAEWDIVLRSDSYQQFEFEAFELPMNFPMLMSGTFFHEFDFQGNFLQPPGKFLHSYNLLSFNTVRYLDQPYLVFGWMESEQSGRLFVDSLRSLPKNHFVEAVVRFCWDITDNLFIRPSWWDSKSEQDQNTLVKFGLASLPGGRSRDALVPNGNSAFQI